MRTARRPTAFALTTGALTALLIASCGPDAAPPTEASGPALTAAKGSGGGPPATAVVRFGNNDAGTSRFGPEHPSSHARDNIIPTTTVIRAGGTVTFLVQAPHRLAIYEPGVRPEDIRLIPGVTLVNHVGPPGPPLIPNFYIEEPNGRLFAEPFPSFGPPREVSYTFDEPGRYLVICAITPHFSEFKMYAWVDVK